MKEYNTECGNFVLFDRMLCCWNGDEQYALELKELNKQIKAIMSINSGLSQPCHCESEKQHQICKEHDQKLKTVQSMLSVSIKNALCL